MSQTRHTLRVRAIPTAVLPKVSLEGSGSEDVVVNVGRLHVGCDQRLRAVGLGSCVALVATDAEVRVGALLHAMLPDSRKHPERAEREPNTFVDLGARALLRAFFEAGGCKRRARFWIVGGAQTAARTGVGKRNVLAARKALWRAQVQLAGEHVGGDLARTVVADPATGRVLITLPGNAEVPL